MGNVTWRRRVAAAFGVLILLTVPAQANAAQIDAAPAAAPYTPLCGLSPGYQTLKPEQEWHIPAGILFWHVYTGGLTGIGTYFFKDQFCQIGKSKLWFQNDGNLVLYDERGDPRWASNTYGRGSYAIMQSDGNFVVYDNNAYPAWASGTCCHSETDAKMFLAVQQDGNVVIYLRPSPTNYQVLWTTDTYHLAR